MSVLLQYWSVLLPCWNRKCPKTHHAFISTKPNKWRSALWELSTFLEKRSTVLRFWCATPSPWRPQPSVKSSLMPCLAQKSRLTLPKAAVELLRKSSRLPRSFYTRLANTSCTKRKGHHVRVLAAPAAKSLHGMRAQYTLGLSTSFKKARQTSLAKLPVHPP